MPDLFGVNEPYAVLAEPPGTTVGEIFKALDTANTDRENKAAKPAEEPQSYFIDPFNILNYVGPKAKPGPIGYAVLAHMAAVPAIAAIINTRINQVVNFTRISRRGNPGFKITPRDPDQQVTPQMKQQIQQYEDFFTRTGWVRNKKRKDNFTSFMKKWARDSLRYDEVVAEIVEGMNARQYPISEFYAIDPATIEIVIHDLVNVEPVVYEPETTRGIREGGKNIAYVQKIQGQIKTEYTEDQLIRAHRNPRTDIDYAYFGYSELEQLITIVTGITNALNYNTTYFSQSNLPQGVLEIVGKYQPEHLEGFKRAWQTLVTGSVGKQWKVPVMALEEGQGFKFTPFKQGNRDMEYSQFMEFLHNVACAVYQIDPEEVGFKAWNAGGSGNKLADNDAPATTINHSKDKGFRPLMHFFEDVFNHEIMDRLAPDLRFEWVGIDIDRAQADWNMDKEKLETGVMTPRMYWDKADVDYKKYGYDQTSWADIPPNQVLGQAAQGDVQHQQQMEQQDQQHQQNMESTLVQGIQQTGLAKQQQNHQMQQQYMQGIQQAGLQGQKDQAQQSMQAGDQKHQQNMAELQHGQQMEQQMAQGVQQQGLQAQQHGQAKEMAGIQHQQQLRQNMQQHGLQQSTDAKQRAHEKDMKGMEHQQTLRQNMQQHGLGMAAKAADHRNAKDLADHNHGNNMEASAAQGMQQQGLQNQKHAQGKEMAELQLMHQLEQLIQSGAQQAAMSKQTHQQTLRQNFQKQQFNRSNTAQAANNQERQTRLQHTLNLEAQKGKDKKDLKKSLDNDLLEIVIELV